MGEKTTVRLWIKEAVKMLKKVNTLDVSGYDKKWITGMSRRYFNKLSVAELKGYEVEYIIENLNWRTVKMIWSTRTDKSVSIQPYAWFEKELCTYTNNII